MSRSTAWFAVPVHHLADPARRAVIARRVGLHIDDLDQLLLTSPGQVLEFTDTLPTSLRLVQGSPCLCWVLPLADGGGEPEAMAVQDAGIPYLRWWRADWSYGAGAEVFTGEGEPLSIRLDNDLNPVVGFRLVDGAIVDHRELTDLGLYHRMTLWVTRRPHG